MKMKGIGLPELMIILAIIGILCAVALPSYDDYRFIHDRDHPERLERYNKLQDQLQEERIERRYNDESKKHDC